MTFIMTRPEDGATLLSAAAVQEMTAWTMTTLAQVQHFFAFHMLANYGCDLSTSGLNMDSVHSKLGSFFAQRTNEGPRYDTYLLYYCGDVFENGDWAFSGRFVVVLYYCGDDFENGVWAFLGIKIIYFKVYEKKK